MLLKNKKINTSQSGDMASQFKKFKQEILSSGKNPNEMLNELVSSGKVSKQQLEKAKQLANLYSYLIK